MLSIIPSTLHLFNPRKILEGRCYYYQLYFIDKEAKAQRGRVTLPRLHSKYQLGNWTWQPGSSIHELRYPQTAVSCLFWTLWRSHEDDRKAESFWRVLWGQNCLRTGTVWRGRHEACAVDFRLYQDVGEELAGALVTLLQGLREGPEGTLGSQAFPGLDAELVRGNRSVEERSNSV